MTGMWFKMFKYLYVASFVFIFLGGMKTNAEIFADYESDWEVNAVDGYIEHTSGVRTKLVQGSHAEQEISIDPSFGISGSSAKIDVTGYGVDGLFKILFAYDENRYKTLDAPDGHNRMSMYVTIPWGGGSNHTFHIGTYSKDPALAASTSTLGNHWYHYYEFRGSKGGYWTKMYIDEHPQHVVGSKVPPPINPTSGSGFDYFDGLSRMYLQMRYGPFESNWPGPYTMHVDEIEFYTENRPENDYSIASAAITYHGGGEFDIDWMSFSNYDKHYNTFEIRHSYNPINTDTDFNNASVLPGSPAAGWGEGNNDRTDNYFRANFFLPNLDESKRIYFAIKDLYSSHPKELKRIDYSVRGAATIAAPMPPNNLTIVTSAKN